MNDQINIFVTSMNQFLQEIASFFPKLIAVICIIFFGWIIATLSKIAVKRFLKWVKFDKFSDRSGLESYLQSDEYDVSLSGIIRLVILLFVITGANALGLTEIADMLKQLAHYLPKVIVAIVVLIFGTLLSRFVNRLVFAWLHGIKFSGALQASTSAEYLVQIFAIFVALEQLDIGSQLITALFIIMFGAVFLALAIAFGLGGKDWAAKIIQERQEK
jgi:hypothetical protein